MIVQVQLYIINCASTSSNILLNTNVTTRVSVNDTHVDINTQLTLATTVYSSVNSASVNVLILCYMIKELN